jgi:hypothetical protein
MKQNIVWLVAVMILFGCASSGANTSASSTIAPDFVTPKGESGSRIVFDILEYGKQYEDYIKITNGTPKTDFMLTVYGYNGKTKEWLIIGTVFLEKPSASRIVHSSYNRRLNQFRWFALESQDGSEFKTDILVKSDNSIRIMVF